MTFDRYSPDDEALIREWLDIRKVYFEDDLPRTGVICRIDDQPVCAGFLRYVEGSWAILDHLITNPQSKPYVRNIAIDGVVKELISIAKNHSIKKILAFSVDAGILQRSKNHGFEKIDHTVIVLKVDSPQLIIEGI